MKVICTSRSRDFILLLSVDEKTSLRDCVSAIELNTKDSELYQEDPRLCIELVSEHIYFYYRINLRKIFIVQIGYCFELEPDFRLFLKGLIDADKYNGPFLAHRDDGRIDLVGWQ